MTGTVSWKEGLALLPQHFQRSDDAGRENLLHSPGQPSSRSHGFLRLSIDESALANGTFSVRDAAGFLPGGIRFDLAQSAGGGLSRQLPEGFGTGIPRLRVHLGIPSPTDSGANVGPQASFSEFQRSIPDSVGGRSRREVALLAPNLSLRFSGEPLDGMLLLPLADLVRGRQGQPTLADDFAPILLDVAAWRPLSDALSRLCASVRDRCLEVERQNPSVDVQGMRLWLEGLHLRTQLAGLERVASTAQIHPADLHAELLRTAGGLAFTRGLDPLPSGYDHSDPASSLLRPLAWIRQALSAGVRSDNQVVALNRESPVLHSIQLPTSGWKDGRRFWLAARSGLATEQLVQVFAQNVKIAPRSKLQAIIVSAVPGLEARMVQPPSFFRATGQTCFELTPSGTLWQSLQDEGFLGVYVPPGLDISAIELLVEGGGS